MKDNPLRLLSKLQEHPAFAPLLGESPARHDGPPPAGWREAEELVRALGRARFGGAVPVLAHVWRNGTPPAWESSIGHALFEIGTPEAHAALQSGLQHDVRAHLRVFLALKSIVSCHREKAYDVLASRLSDDTLSAGAGAALVAEILFFFGPRASTAAGPEWALPDIPDLLRADPRWIRRAIELRRHRGAAWGARMLLRSLSWAEVDDALRRWPDPPPPPRREYTGPRDLLARYEAGHHEEVWRHLWGIGSDLDGELRDEAAAVAVSTMKRVRANVERITVRLRDIGYPFDEEVPAWSPPAADVTARIAQIEETAGGPCPLSLRAFWQIVGEVAWKHAEDEELAESPWGLDVEIAQADPLWIDSPESAWHCVEEWRGEREENHPEVVGPLALWIAPDYLHKANISGGAPYSIQLPTAAADAVLDNEAHGLPFVDYLRLCFKWGGFSRLDRAPMTRQRQEFLNMMCGDLEPF